MSDEQGFTNKLSPAQVERLALLAEEMGEAQCAVGKVLRHGYDSCWPPDVGPTNRELLEVELGHVLHAIGLLMGRGVGAASVHDARDRKAREIAPWLHYEENRS